LIKLKFRQFSQENFLVTLSYVAKNIEIEGLLVAIPDSLKASFLEWQLAFNRLDYVRSPVISQPEFRVTPKSVKIGSHSESIALLIAEINNWLNNSDSNWQILREGLISLANQFHQEGINDIPIVLDLLDIELRRLPWQEWDLFKKYYPNSEVAFSFTNSPDLAIFKESCYPKSKTIRILVVVGQSNGINTKTDLEIIQKLEKKGAEVTVLLQPNLKELCHALWSDRGYHIFVFTGHSSSREDGKIGWIEISDREKIAIEEFKNALKESIDKGLQLAIFNSCDGLGLANQLAELNLPQSIVMREPIPDRVAIDFLDYFFSEYTRNSSLFTAVCKAKKRLEPFMSRYPGVVWLPTLCLRNASAPQTWQELARKSPRKLTKSWQTLKIILITSFLSFTLGLCVHFIVPFIFHENASPPISTIKSIEAFPPGIWQYGGSTTWSHIRHLIDPKIAKEHPDFKLIYTLHPTLPPGTGSGIKMLLDGEISFVQSSRPLTDKEYNIALQRSLILQQIPIAIDGIAIAVNTNLNLPGLTIKQLKDIYTGKITNWNQVGGNDLEIVPYARPLESGTTEFVRHNILGNKNFSDRVVFIEDSQLVFKNLSESNNLGGIYMTSAVEVMNHCEVKALPLSRRPTRHFISLYKNDWKPSDCNSSTNKLNFDIFFNGEYPLARRLFIVIDRNGQEDEKVGETYAKFLLTDEGQKLIKKAGFIPLKLS
jgi:ABC-type phosphate transport system substrate-binding protein